MKPTKSILLVLFALACGDDNNAATDANPRDGNPDAPSFPEPPALGAQIERMGRPAINTALNATFFETAQNKPPMKDAYNQASDPATWKTTTLRTGVVVVPEFARNLAIYDVLDKGAVMNGGCGNQALFNGGGGGDPTEMSYFTLAGVLADDQLYVDTAKTTCNNYLSLEVEVATGGVFAHTQCGGRTPSHDVIDVTYSVLAAGTAGFEIPSFNPKVGDGVAKHTDVSDTEFPFLGAPH